jgi:hypothetical protein
MTKLTTSHDLTPLVMTQVMTLTKIDRMAFGKLPVLQAFSPLPMVTTTPFSSDQRCPPPQLINTDGHYTGTNQSGIKCHSTDNL